MNVKVDKTGLTMRLSFLEKFLSLHGDLVIQKKNISSIRKGRPPLFIFLEIRLPGSFLPGVGKYGSYYVRGRGREFWVWSRGKKYEYTIELKNSSYKRIVLAMNERLDI